MFILFCCFSPTLHLISCHHNIILKNNINKNYINYSTGQQEARSVQASEVPLRVRVPARGGRH